jgi:hypothetical protein
VLISVMLGDMTYDLIHRRTQRSSATIYKALTHLTNIGLIAKHNARGMDGKTIQVWGAEFGAIQNTYPAIYAQYEQASYNLRGNHYLRY